MNKLIKIAIVSTVVAASAVGLGGFVVANQANEATVASNETTSVQGAAKDSKNPGVEQDWYYGRTYYRPAYSRGYWGRPAYYPRRYYWYVW